MQIPAPFDYVRATSVADALELLRRHGEEARLIAGGHSLLPMMKLRLARPDWLIDINDLTELAHIADDAGRAADRRADPARRRCSPRRWSAGCSRSFHDAERVIADPVVRNRGTIGGSLGQADPAEDLTTVCDVLGAELVIAGPGGRRTVPIADFHRGPYETACEQHEILLRDPLPDPAAVGQRVREGRAPGRRLGGRRRRRGRLAVPGQRRHDRARRHRADRRRPRGAGHRRAGAVRGRRPDEELFAEAGRLAAEAAATRSRTSAAPSTTSGTSPTSSPAGCCAGPASARRPPPARPASGG